MPMRTILDALPSKCLQTAFLNEALLDRRDVRLGIAQRGGRCVDRVGAENEVVLVRDGRAENEFSVGPRLELDRFVRRLESRQVAAPQLVGNRTVPDATAVQRTVWPVGGS